MNMNYIEIIKAEFLKRRATDHNYSLRKFAKDLDLKPMHLSYLLKGQRGLSKKSAQRVALAIGLRAYEAQHFRFQVAAQNGRSVVERNLAKQWLKMTAL